VSDRITSALIGGKHVSSRNGTSHGGAGASQKPALEARGVSKTFDGQVVLRKVSLKVMPGEIHALVGQNGSGKSTLIKILSGFHTADDGSEASVNGRRLELGSPAAAREAGLRFVHQDLGVIGDLTVTENVLLGERYPRGFAGRIRWTEANALAKARLARLGLEIDPSARVGDLAPAARAGVAIARATSRWDTGSSVLVLDEPTAFLTGSDVATLFEIVRRISSAGQAVMIVTHHLDEVLGLSDTVTVLRDGRVVASEATDRLDSERLTRLIVGRDRACSNHTPTSTGSGREALRVAGLRGGSVADLSLHVHAGEIVGVAGHTGSGREAVAALIGGRAEPAAGQVFVDGRPLPGGDPRVAIAAGIGWVPGERALGIFADQNVRENLTVASHRRHLVAGRISVRAERAEAQKWIDALGIVTHGSDAPIRTLSGGNQQKVLVARALRRDPGILLLDDPTVGIDVGARSQIHDVIASRASEGTAVVLVSTDTEELVRLADRVLILVRGRVTAELLRGPHLTREAIDAAQLG